MIVILRTPARRVAVAVALSVLVHVLILWVPQVRLPKDESLPPLEAKLEPLPELVAKPVAKPANSNRTRRPKTATQPTAPAKQPDDIISGVPITSPVSAIEAASNVMAVSAVIAQPTVTTEEQPQAAHPLPRHAQLSFNVYKGQGHFQIGTVKHQLEINDDQYTLKSVTRTAGLAKLIKNFQLIQTSRGKSGKQGLRPEMFEEEKINDSDKQNINATFDWTTQKLIFSQGGDIALPTGAQDILSIFYHLSQLPMNGESISFFVSNGKKLEKYELMIGAVEEISTPLGSLHALHLSKLHARNEGGFEIWLGLEYRLLPVKYLLIEPSGEVIGEIVISDIRVADE